MPMLSGPLDLVGSSLFRSFSSPGTVNVIGGIEGNVG